MRVVETTLRFHLKVESSQYHPTDDELRDAILFGLMEIVRGERLELVPEDGKDLRTVYSVVMVDGDSY